ncbi:ribose-5-phosphate isomerase RpiA [Pedobacter sp. MC2016-14]|uniref:ribose-5-phosphate isomerase RpiA n=1 Tax=Pedobacter sp. MC2016-14 TaxID=2897327 RepID=UPI001E32701A|nr:ribose-5-phosphate isomerase RpiA [Pedobacter sp. MC2016-14]MCD0490176.1 ribose-5-phosphate isomerase RpiA [Pedobacter sp. MC2016-14]
MDTKPTLNKDLEKQVAAKAAVKYIKANDIVGLGTGSTAFFVLQEIALLVKEGLKIKGVATSEKTAELAVNMGIELLEMNDVQRIDITIDGADEFTESLQLIKGGGGALFREKIVASLTDKEIIIADSGKKVELLGKFTVPVEVVPLALNYVLRKLAQLNGKGKLRNKEDQTPFVTDNQNYIVDADFGLITNPADLANSLNQIDGVLAHGLFINLTAMVIMGKGAEAIIYSGN